MAEVKFYLITEKVDKAGACPIELTYNYKGKRFRYYTGERVPEKDWDYKKEKVKRSFDGYTQINDLLDSLAEKTKQIVRRYLSEGVVPEPSEVKAELKPKINFVLSKKQKGIGELFDGFIEHARLQGISEPRIRHYSTLRKILLQIEAFYNFKIDPVQYDLKTHDKILNYLVNELDNMPNTIAKQNVILIRFFGYYCTDIEKIVPHPDTKKIKAKWIDTQKVFLTIDEIEKMRSVELPAHLAKNRDTFLFACFIGLRHSDIEKLTPSHLITDTNGVRLIRLKQTKTGADTVLAVNDYAQEIIDKYIDKDITRRTQSKLLPVQFSHMMNIYLKEIGRLAGIDSLVETVEYQKGIPKVVFKEKYKMMSFHTSRHTYAVLSLQKGMPIEILQKQLGHKKIETTMVYAKIVDNFRHKVSLDIWKKKED